MGTTLGFGISSALKEIKIFKIGDEVDLPADGEKCTNGSGPSWDNVNFRQTQCQQSQFARD
jgi:hypothetical protein